MKTFRSTDKINSVLKSGAPASAPPPTCAIIMVITHFMQSGVGAGTFVVGAGLYGQLVTFQEF